MAGKKVIVGRVSGLFGVKGWVKIYSFTKPRENILTYRPWQLRAGDTLGEFAVAEGRVHGKGLIARLDGVDDRDAAAALIGAEIEVDRHGFDQAGRGEFYWADLEGMQVETVDGRDLGTVKGLMETGANDVLVVEGERRRLVPFVFDEVVRSVDMDGRMIKVEWDPDF